MQPVSPSPHCINDEDDDEDLENSYFSPTGWLHSLSARDCSSPPIDFYSLNKRIPAARSRCPVDQTLETLRHQEDAALLIQRQETLLTSRWTHADTQIDRRSLSSLLQHVPATLHTAGHEERHARYWEYTDCLAVHSLRQGMDWLSYKVLGFRGGFFPPPVFHEDLPYSASDWQNLDSLEGSIQNLLSVLYPPFEATAPTVLSQVFQIIDSRYQGDALRCLLDFLVPARHILDTVQQAACAQYSDALFLCEGWPLCLRDQVVIQLAPIDSLLLQPGDFYLQVTPFCDQSARIVVCSLLEEEGLRVELVEETPVPETSYPCIFSLDWLEEINQGRHGTSLSRCLLATEQGVVRLPWERVAVPDFVDIPQICPAKHGIAVSLRLVDTSSASSSKLVKVKETEPEPKPIGWVSPNTWDSRITGANPNTSQKTSTVSEKPCTPCMRRRQGGQVSRAQELRCRYRESYQAAIQNPVAFGQGTESGNMLAVVEEDGDFSKCDDRKRPPETETGDPWCNAEGMWCDPGMQNQSSSSVSGAICKESGEKNTVPYWKTGDTNSAPCMDYRSTNVLKCVGQPEQTTERTTVPFRETRDLLSAKLYGNLQTVNGTNLSAGTRINTSSNDPKEADVTSTRHHGLPFSSGDNSAMNMSTYKPRQRLQNRTDSMGGNPNLSKYLTAPQNRRESVLDGRCSSLSTAVVDTSEKCEVVIVEGQNVRRRENTDPCAEIPQLHVVKCKKSTAFGLVSPKINRKKMAIPDGAQTVNTSIISRNGLQMESISQMVLPPAEETEQKSQLSSARPRPDHLPLGSPDPRAHPLYLGVASLTGGRDRTGRAIVELYGDHQGWRSNVTSQELFQMLLYFYSIIRREIREVGLTLIFDARKTNPQPQVYKALMTLEEQTPQAVNSLVMLVDKESILQPERCPGIQTEVVTSMKALFKVVEVSHLSSRLDGTLSHSYCDWMKLHQKLFPFVCDLHEASSLLLRAISTLEETQRTNTVQTVQQCMMDQRTLMSDVLGDSRLVNLQREGGAILARLRKESDLKYPHCEDLSDAVDSVTSLYNHVEEQAHVLVQRSNMSLEHLEYLLQLRETEGHFTQMQQWFNAEGERHLLEAESVEDSGDRMEQILNSFTGFLIEANDRRHHAMSLASDAERLQQSGLNYPETEAFRTLVCTFKSGLEDFLCRAEACGRELQIMVNVCDFCEQATALASECIEYLEQNQPRIHTMQDHDQKTTPVNQTNSQPVQHQNQGQGPSSISLSESDIHATHGSGTTTDSVLPPGNDISILQTFQDKFLQFSPERFQEMKTQASALRSSRGMRVWNAAWLRCQEARQQLQERMQEVDEVYHQQPHSGSWCERHYVDVVSTNVQTASPSGQSLVVQSTPGPRHPQWEGIVSGTVDLGKRKPILGSNSTNSTTVASCNISVKPEDHRDAGTSEGSKVTPQSPRKSSKRSEREMRRRQTSRARSERDAAALSQSHTVGCQWFPWGRGLRARSVSQDSCATGVATVRSSTPPEQHVRSPSSCSHHGQPSCRILQEAQKFQISRHGSFCSEDSCISDQGAAGGNGTSCCKHSSLPIGGYEGGFCLASPKESASNAQRLQRVLEELVFTEREYVRSLGYILTHYLPLLDAPDIPQDLRGKRGVIFGNLEKLYDFHSHYFLPELEACQREPAMVARCFLRHSESFGLYALYSKNKPQSDALILHRRHDIFKKKQQELGDMMDLSSYLLRPIQRISKYSLLLQDMLALCGCTNERERERAEIHAAAELVRFQMRHGNDLLTMDAIQDCDVNLKEQGQLIRQDEFTVFFRKKKCVRRIFLFEDLILFSKTKRTEIGNDVYVYKQSFKTSDIGMTHNSSVSGLCFEIWFRRRKCEDTYTLKASSMEVKKAWNTDLEKILWDQAAHSRELRMQERVFMGMGRKPFMDIQPSDAAICDRAVSCTLPGRSKEGIEYTRPHSIGSGSTASTTLSQSSSSSGRGSLPPTGYPGNQSQGLETSPAVCSSPEAVTDNELNNHHLHLHHDCERWKSIHHPLSVLDSTDSSGDCVNPFSSSDRSCLSALGGEVVDDSSSFVSQSSKPRPSLCRTPSLRRNSSPAITRKKPGVAPKPPHLGDAQIIVALKLFNPVRGFLVVLQMEE
ncbi:uncharacterized protein LOC133987316 [Scomber scombrus]|uniref:uncharacterized protein LOC133987316 n=1 Tax=Scomber scombrus TaxID=13677 RepID=UPI002DD940C5|nr:uncharacterized protein LOC133987316 [Scomber scombrus]